MLVLVSDLHITDETTANNVNPEAFLLLGDEIVDAASRRGRCTGSCTRSTTTRSPRSTGTPGWR